MTDLLKIMKEELDKAVHEIDGQRVKARQRRPLAKAQAMFFKGLKEVGGDESKVIALYRKLQIFPCRSGTRCQIHTRRRRSLGEVWLIVKLVVSKNMYRRLSSQDQTGADFS